MTTETQPQIKELQAETKQVLRWVRAELLINRERAGRLTDLR